MISTLENERRFIYEKFDLSFSAAVSSVYSGADVFRAYAEVVDIHTYQNLVGETGYIVNYRALSGGSLDNYGILSVLGRDRRIIDSVINGDYETANIMLEEIFEIEFKGKQLPLKTAVFRMAGLAYSIISALGHSRMTAEIDLINEISPVNIVMESKSMVELNRNIKMIFEKINGYQQNAKNKRTAVRAREIEDYVKNHYYESGLSASVICEWFNITPSYFSRVFKSHTGMHLPEYLHILRLDNAKRLLSSTTMSINDIAKKSGFYNSRTFGRVFKAYEGMTPGEFRGNGGT